jgi:pyruvate,water dikinase
MTAPAFPSPFEVPVPAGAEDWSSMYPSYLLPRAETRALDEGRFWFADSMHFGHVMYPFDATVVDAVFLAVAQNSARIFAIPNALGLDVRIVNGYVYLSPVPVTDEAEIGKRVGHFQERAGHYFANWNDLYARWQGKVQQSIDDMRAIELPVLGELDPLEVVTEGRGRSTCFDLIRGYHRLVDEFFLVWQYHFEMLNLGYGAYITFFQFCKQAFPDIQDQVVARMVAGIDVLAFRPDAELRGLARKAVELGVGDAIVDAADAESTFKALGETEAGREWLAALEASRDPWFNYSTEYGFYHDQATWNSDLDVPIRSIAQYVELLRAGNTLDRDVDALVADRDRFVEEYRDLLEPAEQAQFGQLLGLSRTVFPFIEEHNIYVEHWAHSVFWSKMRELGRSLVALGYFQDVEDIFYLTRFELDAALFDAADSWATGVNGRAIGDHRELIDRRKQMMAALRTASPGPALGVAPSEITDPFAIMNYGITTERVQQWLGAGDDAKDSTLEGIPGSPGIAEGVVRIIRSERELNTVQAGEVLVCPTTAPSWAPLFSVVAGVVSDIGGMMSHAAIVCREFGVPAVVGTGFATARLRTGQRVRLDGTTGVVTVLDAEE